MFHCTQYNNNKETSQLRSLWRVPAPGVPSRTDGRQGSSKVSRRSISFPAARTSWWGAWWPARPCAQPLTRPGQSAPPPAAGRSRTGCTSAGSPSRRPWSGSGTWGTSRYTAEAGTSRWGGESSCRSGAGGVDAALKHPNIENRYRKTLFCCRLTKIVCCQFTVSTVYLRNS